MKFCVDCKWCLVRRAPPFGKPSYFCRKPIERGINPVTGEPIVDDFRSCLCFRSEIEPGCRPEAIYFEPKEAKP